MSAIRQPDLQIEFPQSAQTGHTFGFLEWCFLLKVLVFTQRVK